VVEALIVFANEVLVCFLFPLHMGLHRIYHIATTVIHEGVLARIQRCMVNISWSSNNRMQLAAAAPVKQLPVCCLVFVVWCHQT
jgi:hypothetical protein